MRKAKKESSRPPPARARPPLPAAFFRRPTLEVARDLVGAQLCRRLPGPVSRVQRWAITEVEAYDGPADRACHAHRGRTPRTDILFAPGGNWYVYLCYGVHWLLNVTTGPEGFPAAVLIRAAGEVRPPPHRPPTPRSSAPPASASTTPAPSGRPNPTASSGRRAAVSWQRASELSRVQLLRPRE